MPKWSVDSYNNQFLQYETTTITVGKQGWVKDINGLIKAVIKNNEGKRKTSVVYNEDNNSTKPQLENLLDELDHRKTYKVMWEYDNKGYIENIGIYNK